MDQIDLELKNDISELARLNEMLEQFVENNHLSSSISFHLALALEEILTNIIFYGYHDPAEHKIHVNIELKNDEVITHIEDDARPFNPLEAATPDVHRSLEERTAGGLGIHIVRNVMDALEYKRENDRNILTLRKKILESS